ncbi:hypothetical protein [uncultured Fibrella sp.]
MKTTSKQTTAVNKLTGKTIDEMTWDDMRKVAKPISREEAIRKMKTMK